MEKLYEEVCGIVISDHDRMTKACMLSDLYERIGRASDSLDNIIYENLGLSGEDVIDMLIRGN